ncbi:MAG: efflux RND transporter periplasmic adaptor subunit [Devosia sp.]|nr:efflux RND transporter periplasmic adaptor subunit [Devosia sp.]
MYQRLPARSDPIRLDVQGVQTGNTEIMESIMRRRFKISALAGCAIYLSCVVAATAQTAGTGAAPAAVQVGVVTLHQQAVTITTELPGRVSASQVADVRPQVSGIIKSVDFKDGQQVKTGDPLYEIDDAAYQAQVAVEAAAVQKAEAGVSSAQAKVTRYTQLVTSSSVSQSDLQDAQVALAQAQADVSSARASLQAAQINEQLTRITSPITGVIGETSVTVGALVTAEQTTALATVRQLDPSYVDFVETSANLLKIRSEIESGSLKSTNAPGSETTSVHLTLEDGSTYADAGVLTLANVVVSETTGTFSLRATFPNSKRILLPGMFVRATVDLGTDPKAFLVPQRAVTFNASGEATALFAENGKAVSHVLTTNGSVNNAWVVTSGVSDGAQVIVDGLQSISDGSAITPVVVTLDENGVVVDQAASTTATSTETTSAPAAGK